MIRPKRRPYAVRCNRTRSLLPAFPLEKKLSARRVFAVSALFFVVFGASGCGSTSPKKDPLSAPDRAAIEAALRAQVEAWNRADLDGFMATYRRSPDLVFATREGVTRGHAETLARYRKSYDAPEKFGTLIFEIAAIDGLDVETAVVRGTWRLRRAADEPNGAFALVVRRFREGWRVVVDYTTSDPPPPERASETDP
jgi:hypothetical protein